MILQLGGLGNGAWLDESASDEKKQEGSPEAAAIAAIGTGLALLFARKGPKQRVATTEIANEVEPYLKQNLQQYQQGARSAATQQAALAYFDEAWKQMVAACQRPELGNPGKACVEDRQPGGKWDWFARYRDPIAGDQPAASTFGAYLVPAAVGLIIFGLVS